MTSVSTRQIDDETRVDIDTHVIQVWPDRVKLTEKRTFKDKILYDSAEKHPKGTIILKAFCPTCGDEMIPLHKNEASVFCPTCKWKINAVFNRMQPIIPLGPMDPGELEALGKFAFNHKNMSVSAVIMKFYAEEWKK